MWDFISIFMSVLLLFVFFFIEQKVTQRKRQRLQGLNFWGKRSFWNVCIKEFWILGWKARELVKLSVSLMRLPMLKRHSLLPTQWRNPCLWLLTLLSRDKTLLPPPWANMIVNQDPFVLMLLNQHKNCLSSSLLIKMWSVPWNYVC